MALPSAPPSILAPAETDYPSPDKTEGISPTPAKDSTQSTPVKKPRKGMKKAVVLPAQVDSEESSPVEAGAETKQGTATPKPKKAAPRKRKAAAADILTPDTDATPTPKRKKATPKTSKVPKNPAKSKKTTDTEGFPEEASPLPPKAALSEAVLNKVKAVQASLECNEEPNLLREEGTNTAVIEQDDLLAALLIMRIDYQLHESSVGDQLTLSDAKGMVLDHQDSSKLKFNFDSNIAIERAVQEKLTDGGFNFGDLNLLEIEIEMLARKKQDFIEDGFRCAGVWTYHGASYGDAR